MAVMINKNYSKKINKLTIWLLPWPSPCAGICDQNEDGYDGFHFSKICEDDCPDTATLRMYLSDMTRLLQSAVFSQQALLNQ